MKLILSKEFRHDAILGIAGAVSIMGLYIVISEYQHYGRTQENLQMKDVVVNMKETVTQVVPAGIVERTTGAVKGIYGKVTDAATGVYSKARAMLPF